MLINTEIRQLVRTADLIEPFVASGLRHCRYNLRAAHVFSSETGDEQVIGQGVPGGATRRVWSISPTETLVIMTRERVKMPPNLVGEYGQLYRWAQQGLLLINTSIVEPGYDGPLSCIVVNLSKQAITIEPDAEIAKLTFHELSGNPTDLKPEQIPDDKYAAGLAAAAARLPKSFMGIAEVKKDVADQVTGDVTKSLAYGGGIIIALILFATLQPALSSFLWSRVPMSGSDVAQLKAEVDDVKTQLDAAQVTLKDRSEIVTLKRQVAAQAQEIKALESKLPK